IPHRCSHCVEFVIFCYFYVGNLNMPLFSSNSPFDVDVEKATSENNTSEDWGLILEICDKVQTTNGSKDCLKSIIKRLNHNVPNVCMQTLVVLDACINNCGKPFLLEVCTRDFEVELKRQISGKAHPKVSDKLKELLKKWAEGDFKSDPQLSLIPSLYNKLKNEGISFDVQEPVKKSVAPVSKDPNVVNSQQEEDDIAKAIELSLKDTGGLASKISTSSPVNTNLYPNVNAPASPTSLSSSQVTTDTKEARKVRAIYDFEAAEDNELTFKAGEIVHVIDDSDANWWKGSNQRGEGLFPANFVTYDLSVDVETKAVHVEKKSVQFNDNVEVKTVEREEPIVTEISVEKIDELLHRLHEADPTGERPDSPELISLEEQCAAMGPLIDQQLENVDRRHATLTNLSHQLVDALNMYHSLMRDFPVMQQGPAGGNPYATVNYPMPHQQKMTPPPPPQYVYQMQGNPNINPVPGQPPHLTQQVYNGIPVSEPLPYMVAAQHQLPQQPMRMSPTQDIGQYQHPPQQQGVNKNIPVQQPGVMIQAGHHPNMISGGINQQQPLPSGHIHHHPSMMVTSVPYSIPTYTPVPRISNYPGQPGVDIPDQSYAPQQPPVSTAMAQPTSSMYEQQIQMNSIAPPPHQHQIGQ
ncbi:STAM2 (predicted), partial [Pycnogonum litorale]